MVRGIYHVLKKVLKKYKKYLLFSGTWYILNNVLRSGAQIKEILI